MIKALFTLLIAAAMLSSVSLLTVNVYAENANCSRDCEAPTLGVLDNGQRVVEKGLTINGRAFDVAHQIQTVTTTNVKTGGQVKATLLVHENNGISGIRQVALAIADYKDDRNRNEIATIIYNQAFTGVQSVSLVDPEGILKDVSVKPTPIDQFKTSLEFSFVIAKPVDASAILIQTVDESRSSRTNVFLDAIAVTGKSMVEKPAEPARDIPAPLQQVKSGVKPQNVECRQGMELIFRTSNGAPACVYPFTAKVLKNLGLAN
jgi:hypothetical protein